ncbi:MAG: glycosyltransferase [Planctomycetes bacterium]|nr:glycosyltransferase [Planctomycetota bacterium]
MKVVLVGHGLPPELVGGTEGSVECEARMLAARGDDVCIVAGTLSTADSESELVEPASGRRVRVVRLARTDLYSDHWHKTLAPAVTRGVRRVLREFAPDVVHVHHWIRLSRDLVLAAAREGVAAVVSLHDAWTGCPIAFRVETSTLSSCSAPVGPHPCLACAARVGPRTRWVKREQEFMLLAERQRDLARELELARALLVPTAAHRGELERVGVLRAGDPRVAVLAPRPAATALELGAANGRATSRREPRDEGRLVLGVLGHLMPHKGQELVLAAVARLAGRVDIEVRFAGADADPTFARALRERAPTDRVRFLGAYERASLAAHPVADVHAWVSASRAKESFGLLLDEARALGLATVLADHGAFAERGRDGGSLLFAPGDDASLAAALERLAIEPGLWSSLGAQARSLADARESADAWCACVRETLLAAAGLGAPVVPPEEWFAARMAQEFLDSWDRGVRGGGIA